MNLLHLIPNFIHKNVSCAIFGHKIVTVKNVTSYFKEYRCTVCEMELTNDLQNKKTFLTPELREINETLFNYNKKHLSHM